MTVRTAEATSGRWQQWRIGNPAITNIALCALGCGLVLLARQFVSETHHFTMGFSGVSGWSAVLYLAAVMVVLTQPVNRWTLWIVLGWAVVMRGMTLFASPYLSSDIYRYVWDGVVQHAHVNPYRYVHGDPALTWLRDGHADVFAKINRRDYAHTIYPPVAQMVFWLATLFSPTVQGMKLMMFAFECITAGAIIALLRRLGRPAEHVLVYAWCPLLVWEIAGAGHVDAAICAWIALALLFRAREQQGWVGFFLGCAVMTKFYPLVLLPALWRRGDWRMPAALVSVCVAGYAIYSSVGRLVFGFLGGYAEEEGMNSGTRYFLLDAMHHVHALANVPKLAFLGMCLLVFAALTWWCWKYATVSRAEGDGSVPAFARGALWLALALMLLFSPHYAWYLAWLVPLVTVAPELPALAYVCAFFYGFTTRWADPGPDMFLLNSWLYAAVLLAFVVAFAMRNRWPAFSCHEPGQVR